MTYYLVAIGLPPFLRVKEFSDNLVALPESSGSKMVHREGLPPLNRQSPYTP